MISFLQCIEAFLEGILTIQSVAIRCQNVPVDIATYRVEKYVWEKAKVTCMSSLWGLLGSIMEPAEVSFVVLYPLVLPWTLLF